MAHKPNRKPQPDPVPGPAPAVATEAPPTAPPKADPKPAPVVIPADCPPQIFPFIAITAQKWGVPALALEAITYAASGFGVSQPNRNNWTGVSYPDGPRAGAYIAFGSVPHSIDTLGQHLARVKPYCDATHRLLHGETTYHVWAREVAVPFAGDDAAEFESKLIAYITHKEG